MSLHHLALGAQDVERIAAFYRDLFELVELRRHHHDDGTLRSVWLDLGGPILMVEETKRARPLVDGVDAGFFLASFHVDEASRRDAIEARLDAMGIPIDARTAYSSYARDPEGNRFAFSLPLPNLSDEPSPTTSA